MVSEPQVAAILVRGLVAALVELGIDRGSLLASAGISPAVLGVLRLRLPWRLVEELLEAAERLSGDDRLGFHLARSHDLETLQLPGLLFFASKTLEDASRRIIRVQRLWSDAHRGDFLLDPPRLVYSLNRPERGASRHCREQALADMVIGIRQAVGVRFSPREVRFPHARDGDLAEYEALFGCPVGFAPAGAPVVGPAVMVLDEELRRLPLVTANSLFAGHYDRQAEDELTRLPSGQTVTGRVQALLTEDFEAQRLAGASVESVAQRLRTTPRTLQRVLKRESTSFARELEAARRRSAEALLLAGQDIAEVSWRLGYAEPAVFHRAFKRWTGQTPERFRQSGGG